MYKREKAEAMVQKFIRQFTEFDLLHALDYHYDKPDSYLKDRIRESVKMASKEGKETQMDGASAFDARTREEIVRLVLHCIKLMENKLIDAVEEGRGFTAKVTFGEPLGRGFFKGIDFKKGPVSLSAVRVIVDIDFKTNSLVLVTAYPAPNKAELLEIARLRGE